MSEDQPDPYLWLVRWRGTEDANAGRPYQCRYKNELLRYHYRRAFIAAHFHPETGEPHAV